jgi:glycerate-2-kinase
MKISGSTLRITGEDGSLDIDLKSFPEILVLGMGKAAARMAAAAEDVLGGRISAGAVVTKHGQGKELRNVMVFEAGHPVPDEHSIDWAREITRMAADAGKHTLVITLVSGGGSSLFSLPREGITLSDLQEATKVLLRSGADIGEINCIRKHLSRVKGGGFARFAYPARVVTLILSDVIGDSLDTIASGITVPDGTTFAQALSVVEKRGIASALPPAVLETLEAGARGEIPETPKPGDPLFGSVTNLILGNNATACAGALEKAAGLGYRTRLLPSPVTGDVREAARFFATLAHDVKREGHDGEKPLLVVAGGETTVKVNGAGKGGRNQEMALAFLAELMNAAGSLEGIHFLSAGTDGVDGPTDAAGAMICPGTADAARREGISPGTHLLDNDAYHFFEKAGGLIVTGPTGTNVCDTQLLCIA